MLKETTDSLSEATCFLPLLDQVLGLKICSTYYVQNSPTMIQSIFDTLKKPFKFSLFVEKSDPTAKIYIFKYNKNLMKVIIEYIIEIKIINTSIK